MKRKLKLITLIMFIISILPISVFATDGGFKDINEGGNVSIILEDGTPIYHRRNIEGSPTPIYLYETSKDGETYTIDLGTTYGGTRFLVNGQFTYVPLDNQGNPKNYAVYRDSKDGLAWQKLKDNIPDNNLSNVARYQDINIAKNFVLNTSFKYPQSNNWAFKHWTSAVKKPTINDVFFYNKDANVEQNSGLDKGFGNPRYVFDRHGKIVSGYEFMADEIGSYDRALNDFTLEFWNILDHPWKERSDAIKKGFQNSKFELLTGAFIENMSQSTIASKLVEFKNSKREDFNNFYEYLLMHHKIMLKVQRGYDVVASKQGSLEMQMAWILKKTSVSDFAGYNYGHFELVQQASNGTKYTYANNLPRFYSEFDLYFGSTLKDDGKTALNFNGDERFVTRVREYDKVTKEVGRIIPTTEPLQAGQDYQIEWFMSYRQLTTSSRTESHFDNFKNDFQYELNKSGSFWGADSQKNLTGYKLDITPEAVSLKDIPFIEKLMPHNQPTYYLNEMNQVGVSTIGYKQIFTVPQVNNAGANVTEIAFKG